MKLALVVDDYLPHSTRVGAKMMHELARELVLQGNQVTVITPESGVSLHSFRSDSLDNVSIWRFQSGPLKDKAKVIRALNESLLSFKAWRVISKRVKKDSFDGIIYYSPSIFLGSLVEKLKKRCNCKSYLVLRDFFPQWAVDSGLIRKGSLIERYFRFFEAVTYKNADMIGVMSHRNLEIFNETTDHRYRASVLRNWSSIQPHQVMGRNKNLRQRLGLKDEVIYFYGGNIGHAQDMKNLMRLVRSMQKYNNAHFVFVGQGDEVHLINDLATEWKLCNFSYLSSVSQYEYRDMLAQVDIGLFSLSAKHTTHNFPGKLLGYMVQSLPILGSVNRDNDLMNLVEDNAAGFISVNGDHDSFLANACRLHESLDLRRKIGLAGYNLLTKEFAVSIAALTIYEFLEKGQ
jgi:glycosyltransferase involved in cell wall biosynthesis